MARVEEDWFSIDVESKLNRKIDSLQTIVQQQSDLIQTLSAEIKQLKQDLIRPPCEHLSSQTDRTHQLLEELKLIKQRELNMMLREKIPVPFFSTKSSFPQQAATVPSLPSPLFLAQLQRNTIKKLDL
jgi:hypothetical protein